MTPGLLLASPGDSGGLGPQGDPSSGWREHSWVTGPRWATLSQTQRSAVSLSRKSASSPRHGQVQRPGSRCWRGDSKGKKGWVSTMDLKLKICSIQLPTKSRRTYSATQTPPERERSTLVSFSHRLQHHRPV